MKDSLVGGLEGTSSLVVTADHSPAHLLPTIVLSTPLMIQLMEELCTTTVAPHLGNDETTVGVHVDVYHRSAARAGDQVDFACTLDSIDGNRLGFSVSAKSGDRVVGEGRHQRFVVSRSRFAS